MDVNFEKRIPILAPAFLWIISQYYPYYFSEGLKDPAIVTEHTESYWRDNDVYAQFAADNIQEVYTPGGDRDSSARVTLTEIYTEFKIWFRDAFPGTKPPERSIVRTELSSRWGRMHGNAWHGIRIITNENVVDLSSALGGRKTVSTVPTIIGEVAHMDKAPKKAVNNNNFVVPDGITKILENAANKNLPTILSTPPKNSNILPIVLPTPPKTVSIDATSAIRIPSMPVKLPQQISSSLAKLNNTPLIPLTPSKLAKLNDVPLTPSNIPSKSPIGQITPSKMVAPIMMPSTPGKIMNLPMIPVTSTSPKINIPNPSKNPLSKPPPMETGTVSI
jgi:hypothetical protein